MSGSGKPATPEEFEKISELLDMGIKPNKMKLATGLSKSAIYNRINRKGISLTGRVRTVKPVETLPDDVDFSKLPDEILFNPKMFPGI